MVSSQFNWSARVDSVLERYPKWQQMVLKAMNQPFLDASSCPEVIEIFDQYGLLAGRVHSLFSYENHRSSQEKSEFIAWIFDGELTVFYVDSELVVNRLQLLCEAVSC
jgi:hypothetical protein